MDLRHLRYFVAVAEEESFTRAAERLWIAQPGLSQQIRALERELGVTLFDRLSRGVILTEPGRQLLEQARLAIAAADDAHRTARDAGAGLVGHLRLGLCTQARSELWPRLVEAFRERRPRVQLTMVEAESGTVQRDLRDGRLDAGIVLSPVTLPKVSSTVLKEAPVAVALGERHALAHLQRISPADLDGQTVAISGARDGAAYDRFVTGLLESLAVRHHVRRSGYGSALFADVRAGGAVALVPATGIEPERQITLRPFDAPAMFRFELAWPTQRASAVLGAFVDSCRATATARPVPRLAVDRGRAVRDRRIPARAREPLDAAPRAQAERQDSSGLATVPPEGALMAATSHTPP
jgi:DNA-binding transcriptional LysR family regulator